MTHKASAESEKTPKFAKTQLNDFESSIASGFNSEENESELVKSVTQMVLKQMKNSMHQEAEWDS